MENEGADIEGILNKHCCLDTGKFLCLACIYAERRKMENDGPYRHSKKGGKCVASCIACAYADGRKAAEKDFQELLEIAQELCDDIGDDVAEKFRAWKKARGIE